MVKKAISAMALPSIRSKTVTLVLACAVPTIVGFAALSYDAYARQREHLVHDAARMAQALMSAVERDLSAGETAARALASSPSLSTGDLDAFRAQATSLLTDDFPAFAFVLSDIHGKALLNTRFAKGAPMPANGNVGPIREVAVSGRAATSDLYKGDAQQPRMVSIDVPVQRDGAVRYVLSAQLRPEHINTLLSEQGLPPHWNGQVFDRNAIFVGRNRGAHQVIGQVANPILVEAMKRQPAGTVELISRENMHMLVAYTRSPQRGWFVSVGAPRASAGITLDRSLPTMLLSVAALLTSGFLTAWFIGGAIGRSVRALCEPAVALGRGERLALEPMTIREPAEVAAALVQVDSELQRYRGELEQLVQERTAELQRSNALIATVYASAPVGLSLLDCDLRVVMVNDYLAAVNGLSVEEHLGRTLPEILGATGIDIEQAYRQVRDTGEALTGVESSGPTPAYPTEDRHWIVSYHPVYGVDHKMMGISAVLLDISEQKLLSQRLHDISEQFHALFELSGDAHMLLALGAGYISGNQAAARMFGCASVEEFITLSPATTSPELQPDGQRSAVKAAQLINRALEVGSLHTEWLYQRVDGQLFHADVLLTSLDIGGKGILQVTVRDISARIAADQALRATSEQLRQSERFIRTVTDSVPGMVGYWDSALRCQFANRLYLESFGLTERELLGQPIDLVMGPEQMVANAPYLREVMAGRAAHFARELGDAHGQVRYTWSNYIPDFDDQGQVRGFYVLVSDISELKRTEVRLQSLNEQLVQALDQAEMASSAKTEFLANMSHEIRTPMNAIMGLARLLEEAPLARREREYVAKMTMSTRSLLGILNDVLDFSKIEAGQLTLEFTAFTLDQVLRSISVLLGPVAFAKGVELVFAIAPDVPLALSGDPMRLEQVLLNLVGNAIKFTEAGEVVLSIATLRRGEDDIALRFAVRDSGIGIDPAQQGTIFEAFSQGDSSTSRKFGGTGLGLAICRRLVHLMGGSIAVRSDLGRGAEFSFDSHFGALPQARGLVAPELPGLAGRTLLLVDDNPSMRSAVSLQCEAFGWRVAAAASGAEALEALRGARAAGTPFDYLLVDSAMPGMDGISFLTHARADDRSGDGADALGHGNVPRCAMMVAESAREQLAELADDLQLAAILSKPVTPTALAGVLLELYTGKQQGDTAAAPEPLAGRLQGIHVLLVEDNQINQEVANYILLHAGAAVDIAANGRIAVDMLTVRPERYDAVLMDIQMPVMNGYEATEAIRRMGLADLPIIAMTANAMEDDRAHALNVGMNAHVAKPIDVDSLVTALNRVTAGGDARELRAPARAGYGAVPDAQPEAAPAPAAPLLAIEGIDLGPTLDRFGGNYASFVNMLKRFESSQGSALSEVRALVASDARAQAVALVHRLRGVAANLGAAEVAALALDAEQALRSAGEAELMVRLATLETALAKVFKTARALDMPAAPSAARPPARADAALGDADLQEALANLLALLQNNNMKALSAYAALRPAIDAQLSAADAAALAEAISTLGFASAALLVQDMKNRRDTA